MGSRDTDSTTLSLHWHQMEMSDQLHALAALSPDKNRSTHCAGGWVSPRGDIKVLEKRNISCPLPRFECRVFCLLTQTLYRLRYPVLIKYLTKTQDLNSACQEARSVHLGTRFGIEKHLSSQFKLCLCCPHYTVKFGLRARQLRECIKIVCVCDFRHVKEKGYSRPYRL